MMTSPKSSNRRECGPATRQCESFAAKPCRKLKSRNPDNVVSRQCRQACLQRTAHYKLQLTPIKNLHPRLRPQRASGHPDRASPTWNSSKNPRYKEDGAHSQRQGPASAKVSPLTSSITSDTENAGRMALPHSRRRWTQRDETEGDYMAAVSGVRCAQGIARPLCPLRSTLTPDTAAKSPRL